MFTPHRIPRVNTTASHVHSAHLHRKARSTASQLERPPAAAILHTPPFPRAHIHSNASWNGRPRPPPAAPAGRHAIGTPNCPHGHHTRLHTGLHTRPRLRGRAPRPSRAPPAIHRRGPTRKGCERATVGGGGQHPRSHPGRREQAPRRPFTRRLGPPRRRRSHLL